MVALDEYAKICNLIASCNDIINGKFILADYKISNILKNITNSKEVYNLLANCLNNFDFERELSRAQLRSASKPNRFVLPQDKEKILPFVFCILVNINNKNIDFDIFLKEFYKSETNNHSEEYSSFANAIILPFRDIIAQHFEIPVESVKVMKMTSEIPSKKEEKMKEEKVDEEKIEDDFFEEDEEEEEKVDYPTSTADKVETFLNEISINCENLITEIESDRKTKADLREDIVYLANTIIHNCEKQDITNVCALIISFEYVVAKVRSIKFITKELKRLLVNFYNE